MQDYPGYFHILDHGAKSVDLSRLNDGAPVLVNHGREDHVGVVEKAWVGNDRVGRALVRFGQSERASEVFQDVIDGIRRHISVGATITGKVVREEKSGKSEVYRILGWQPREISFASVPADGSVGVGRTDDPKPEPKRRTKVEDDEVENQPSTATIERAQRSGAKEAGQYINEYYALGEQYGCLDLAREYAGNAERWNEKAMGEFRKKAFDGYVERKNAELEELEKGGSKPLTNLGLSEGEVQRYSITRALNAWLEKDWADAGFERECNEELERVLGKEARGVFIPHDVQMRAYRNDPNIRREMTTGGAGTGAEYVGTRHSPENFIEQLRNNVVVARAGARMLPGMRQNLDIPKKTSGATFAWVAEGGTTTLTDLGTDNLLLTPKTVTGGTQASRRMLKQSLPAIDDMIMQDLVEGAAEAIDLGALQGTGAANQPTGVFNTSGVNTQTVAAAGNPTLAETVGFRTAVATDNALRGALSWVTTSAVVGNMMLRALDAGSGRFLIDPVNPTNLLGFGYQETNAITAARILFGNWNEVLIAMWGVLDLMPDPYGAANAGALIIRAFQDIDIGVRHAESFCVSA